jgi:wyosine [tRNA(Phe)-imidazoG37] synthetase (radical SAM superfamily)
MARLRTDRHDRDSEGKAYVYAVASRRAGGVSIGINLNTNNACNWRCVYCQVPGLVYGRAPRVDLARLESELAAVLEDVRRPGWLERHAPEGFRRLADVAFSGNGEPTMSGQLVDAVWIAVRALELLGPAGRVPLVLITNGSLVHRPRVREALSLLAGHHGEAWFKLDSATRDGLAGINSWRGGPARHLENLRLCASLLPTWIQTIVFERSGAAPPEAEQRAYLDCLRELVEAGVPLRGVRLYGLARPSHQPEAPQLAPLPGAWLDELARRIEKTGLPVQVSP